MNFCETWDGGQICENVRVSHRIKFRDVQKKLSEFKNKFYQPSHDFLEKRKHFIAFTMPDLQKLQNNSTIFNQKHVDITSKQIPTQTTLKPLSKKDFPCRIVIFSCDTEPSRKKFNSTATFAVSSLFLLCAKLETPSKLIKQSRQANSSVE